jgi:hypothetical protein
MLVVEDIHGDVGPVDVTALEQIRRAFVGVDGLVDGSETGIVPSLLDTTHLQVRFSDGIGNADEARFDIRWSTRGYYNVHHVDDENCNFRFDYHPKPNAPVRHFHPLPDAPKDDVEESCITVREPQQVARAVHVLWRKAYDQDDQRVLNEATNPP